MRGCEIAQNREGWSSKTLAEELITEKRVRKEKRASRSLADVSPWIIAVLPSRYFPRFWLFSAFLCLTFLRKQRNNLQYRVMYRLWNNIFFVPCTSLSSFIVVVLVVVVVVVIIGVFNPPFPGKYLRRRLKCGSKCGYDAYGVVCASVCTTRCVLSGWQCGVGKIEVE